MIGFININAVARKASGVQTGEALPETMGSPTIILTHEALKLSKESNISIDV